MTQRRVDLVGRGGSVRRVRALLADGASVEVSGPAGVGKSRLAAEVLADPTWGRCLVDRLVGVRDSAPVHLSTLASGGRLPPSAGPAEAYAATVGRWTRQVGEAGRPLVLLDDAPDADPLTAWLLRTAVESGVARLLVCRRSTRVLPPDLEALRTAGHLVAEDLAPLPGGATRDLVRAVARPASLEDHLVHRVQAMARGNPLFARELTLAALAGGRDALESATTLEAVVGRAVLARDPAERRLLDLVAVAEPVSSSLLFCWRDELHRLRQAGLLVRDGRDEVRLDHPLRRQWLLDELGVRTDRVLAGLLDLLGPDAVRDLDPIRYVEWCRLARRPVDGDAVREAAATALARGDPATALRVLEGTAVDDPDALRAQALVAAGEEQQGRALLERRLASGPPTPDLAVWCVRFLAMAHGDVAAAEEVVAALERSGRPDAEVAVARCRLWLWVFRGIEDGARVDDACRLVARLEDPTARHEMLAAAATTVLHLRGPFAARSFSDECEKITARDEWSTPVGRTLVGRVFHLLVDGRLPAATRLVEHTSAKARRAHDVETAAWLAGAGSWTMAMAGRPTEAVELSRPGARPPEATRWFGFDDMGLLAHAGCRFYVGEDGASVLLAHAARAIDGPGAMPALRARALDLAAGFRGEHHDDDAVRLLLDQARSRRHLSFVAVLGAECLDLDSAPDVLTGFADAFDADLGGLMTMTGEAARARLDRDADRLCRLGLRAERAGLVLPALRLLTDAARLDDGARRAADHRPPPERPVAALLRVLERWDGPDPWFLRDLPTPRQREVALAVARGRTASDVAAALVLSRRTVENHLQRVYERLGVHDRHRLAEALAPPG